MLKKSLQKHLVDYKSEAELNREKRVDMGQLSRPNWVATTKYEDVSKDGSFRGPVADKAALEAIQFPIDGDSSFVYDSDGIADGGGGVGQSGIPAFVANDGTQWGVVKLIQTATGSLIKETVNNARFAYYVLSGSPSLTFDKTNPLTPTLTVSGGTIALVEVRDSVSPSGSQSYVYTFNATWSHALDAYPSHVVKIKNTGANQQDDDTTPSINRTSYSTTQVVYTFNAVSEPYTFIFSWNNV